MPRVRHGEGTNSVSSAIGWRSLVDGAPRGVPDIAAPCKFGGFLRYRIQAGELIGFCRRGSVEAAAAGHQ